MDKNRCWTNLTNCEVWQEDLGRCCNSRKSSGSLRLCDFHQSPMPSESKPVYGESIPEAQVDSFKVWLCKKAFQGLKISLQTRSIQSTKNNDMGYDQLVSDLLTYMKKRTRRQHDSILLRHMDDVVGPAPKAHLVIHEEQFVLDGCGVLRTERNSFTFLGFEVTKTSRGFTVRNSAELEETLLNHYGLENSRPTVNLGGRSTVMELASATPLDGHDYSNFRTAVGNSSSWHHGEQTCNSPFDSYPHKCIILHQKANDQRDSLLRHLNPSSS